MEEKLGLKEAVRAVAAEARSAIADHPMPDELVDYHAGDLTPAELERIQDHLAVCPDCARAALAMDALPDPATLAPGERLGDRELTAEWERFRERTGPIRLSGRHRWLDGPSLRYGMAAVAALAVLGLAFQLGRRTGSSPPPRNLQTIELYSADEVLRGGADADADAGSVRIEAWADAFVLRLALDDGRPTADHDVVIAGADGRDVWQQGGLHAVDGAVSALVPRDRLPAGAYRVRLFGPEPGRAPQAEYSLILRR